MWTFLNALAGGLIALLGSVGMTYYVQQQAVKVNGGRGRPGLVTRSGRR
jgi:hypothetical protein